MNLTDVLDECKTPDGVREYAGSLRKLSLEMWQGSGPRDDKDLLPHARGTILDLAANLLDHRAAIDGLAGGIVNADGGEHNDFTQALNFLLGAAQARVASEFSKLQAASCLVNQAGALDFSNGISRVLFSRWHRAVEALNEDVKTGLAAIGETLKEIRGLVESGTELLKRFEGAFKDTSAAPPPVEAAPAEETERPLQGEPPVALT
ncbi:MAG: hypothetical protein K2Z81_28910 [Cyanobacteria bacterium]|nr:hypothetical protein [Cyanobacteriota bacterium]